MAQEPSKDTRDGAFSTTSRSLREAPTWLAGALVVLRTIRVSAFGSVRMRGLRVPRGRAGTYEPIDFMVVLLTLALSGAPDLKTLYGQLAGTTMTVLAGVWLRHRLPSRSALSRFLAAVQPHHVAQFATWVLEDVVVAGLRGEAMGGLLDRDGQRTLVFDDDGTYYGAQQRSLAEDPERPVAVRRSAASCAAGYHGGSKRADVTCTRTVLQQAHSGEWLGCWSAPGNGHPFAQLEPAARAMRKYLKDRGLAASQGLLRLDGLYGVVRVAALLAGHGLGYLMRCKDYRLLRLRSVQQVLAQPPHASFATPDSPVRREAWQVLQVAWFSPKDPTQRVSTRLLITRHRAEGPGKPRVGKRIGEWVYELFVTDRSPTGWSIGDCLSVYFARGGFEGTLAQEDREHDLDHTVSWTPAGQQVWTLLGQLVWNVRIRLGACLRTPLVRLAEWSAAICPVPALPAPPTLLGLPAPSIPSVPSTATSAPRPMLALPAHATPMPPSEPPPASGSAQPARHVAAGTVGRGVGRYRGADFQWVGPTLLKCPAGKLLRPVERWTERRWVRVIYAASAKDCRTCLLASKCRGRPSRTDGMRKVSVLEPLPTKSASPADSPGVSTDATDASATRPSSTITLPRVPTSQPPRPPPFAPPAPSLGNRPVLWLDVGAADLRHRLRDALDAQHVEVTLPPTPTLDPERHGRYSRDQRAHRRQTWNERLAHNQCRPGTEPQILIHGVPSAISNYHGLHRANQDAA